MPMQKFRGIMPIMPTAINPDGELDLASQRRLVDYCIENNAVAVGHFGGASEYHKISVDQRQPLLEAIIEQVNHRVPVFIGVAALDLRSVIQNARQAHDMGADYLLLSSPISGELRHDRLFDYYKAVSDAVSLPIIAQDTGASAPVYSAAFFYELFEKIDNVVSVKVDSGDFLEKTVKLNQLSHEGIPVIGGAAGLNMVHLLRQGVTAFMTGTEAVELHDAVVQAYLSDNELKATEIYYQRLLPYLMIYVSNPSYLLKWMLKRRGIIMHDTLLPPTDVPETDEAILRELEWVLENLSRQV